MIRLLRWILLGHIHQWKTIGELVLKSTSGATGTRYIQQCESCGVVVKRDLI